MVIGKIKPTATIVAQFAAGVEVEAIQHEGKMYLPVVGMGEFSVKEDAPTTTSTKSETPAPSKAAAPKTEKPAAKDTKSKEYTKDELMAIETKELIKICKNEFDIDPDDYEGKNTNKKLRDLILDAQKGKTAAEAIEEDDDEDTDEEETSDKTEETGDELSDQVAEILEDFDAGKKNKKKTISAICALVDDADTDKVTELVEHFEDEADADIDDIAEKIAKALEGKEEKPAKKETKKSKKKEELVDVDDLEVGDRVSVWWDDDNQDWFDGEVKSIKKGKVVIAYDDDTEDAIDPEIHTKIKKLAK